MAEPVISVNNLTGSDSAASGSGPGDGSTGGSALTGSNASSSADGLTVTLPNADLSNVLTNGAHALWLNTSSGRRWAQINGKGNSGTVSAYVTLTSGQAYGASLTGQTYAIGGKRASVSGLDKLLNQGTSSLYTAGDIGDFWEIGIDATGTVYTQASGNFGRWDSKQVRIYGVGGVPELRVGNWTWLSVTYGILDLYNLKFSAATAGQGTAVSSAFESFFSYMKDLYLTGLNYGLRFPNNYTTGNIINCAFNACTYGVTSESNFTRISVKASRFNGCTYGVYENGSNGTPTLVDRCHFSGGTNGCYFGSFRGAPSCVESQFYGQSGACILDGLDNSNSRSRIYQGNVLWGGTYAIDDVGSSGITDSKKCPGVYANAYGGQSTAPYRYMSAARGDLSLGANPFNAPGSNDFRLTPAAQTALQGLGIWSNSESLYQLAAMQGVAGVASAGGGGGAPRFGNGGNFYV